MSEIITIFPDTWKTDEPHLISVETVIGRIKSCKHKNLIDKIRNCDDKDKKLELKKKLPNICFSGQFTKRANEGLKVHSGLVTIDFDHLGERLTEFKARICQDKYTHIAFISPSGDGIKIVVRIPASIKTHKLSCDALFDYYKDESLDEFKEVSRVCFESADPDIYYNPDSEVFTLLKETEIIKRTIATVDIITDFDDIIDRIVTWLDSKCEHYKDGNKHNYLVKFSTACNRFGIPETIACQKAIFRFISTASPVDPKDYVDLFRTVYKNYGNLSCTAHFDLKGTAIETTTNIKLTEAIFDITLPLKDVIYLDNVRETMLQTFHTGRARGETTYFKTINEHWRWKRRHLVLFHGIMNHGKSVALMQFCLIKSIKDDSKWGVFSPEQDPPDDFYDDLIHAYIGKNTQPYFDKQMTEDEYISGMDFIKDHFFYIFPDDEAPNQEYINRRFEEVILKHKIDGCIIDPYNQLDNDIRKFGGREDQYLSSFLTIQRRFAQKYNIYMVIVAHPKGNLCKDSHGDYECPDVYDLSGGAMWGNKCDDIICIYRPFFTSNRADTTVKFISQKIKKRKLCGSPGDVLLDFDVQTGRYIENYEGKQYSPFGMFELKKVNEPIMRNFYEQDTEEIEELTNNEDCPY